MHQASVGFHCPECVKSGKQKVVTGPGVFRTRPILTQVLIFLNVAAFVFVLGRDGSGAFGGEVGKSMIDYGLIAKFTVQSGGQVFTVPGMGVGEGEWYRMITSGFMHYGVIHLAFNMYALWILGQAVEHIGGRLRFGIVYVVSMLAGSVGALLLSPDGLTAGASGAIFGLMGAVFVAMRSQGIPFRNSPLLPALLLNLAFTFGLNGISIGGHLGGLAGGAAAGWILFDFGARRGVDKRIPLALAGALGLVCLVVGVMFASSYSG
jgi:membrane associated rhomboid family serine protease